MLRRATHYTPTLFLIDKHECETVVAVLNCTHLSIARPTSRFVNFVQSQITLRLFVIRKSVVEYVKDKLKSKQQKAKSYHDRGAKVLLELDIGQDVIVAG